MVSQERASSRQDDGDDFSSTQGERLQQMLAELPLPAPAVVIDVRPQATYDYPLLWNLATEIEDLAVGMRLKRIPHWEYLEECIDFLHIGTEEVFHATRSITLTSRADEQAFASDGEFAAYVTTSCINRVRTNRQSAAVYMGQDTTRPYRLTVGPVQSIVRVFFLVDMSNEDTFAQAIGYASALKQYNYEHDMSEHTGHDERISTFAICLNADPKQRQELFHRHSAFESAFDTAILIQAYRDDDTGQDMQTYEVEQIMYALLLASPGEISGGQDAVSEEELGRYLAFVEQPPVAPSCSIYMIGVSSTEYSARWGQRWLSYGLVAKLIELVENTLEVEKGDVLLQLPSGGQWLATWWGRARSELPNILVALLPVTQPVMSGLFLTAHTQRPSSLAATMGHVETLYQQAETWYGDAAQQMLQSAAESISYLQSIINNKIRDRNKRSQEGLTPEDEALSNIVMLQEQGQQFLVSLFRGAKGALPRAILQLDALSAKLQKLQKRARHIPDLKQYQEQFEQAVKTARQDLGHSFHTWRVPLFGTVLRSTVLIWVVALGIALILASGVATLLLFPWQQLIVPLLLPLVGGSASLVGGVMLRLLLVILVLVGTIVTLIMHGRRLHAQRDIVLGRLSVCLQTQREELQALLVARAALQLLATAGLYSADGEECAYSERSRKLGVALKAAKDEAIKEQQRAFERLRLSLSVTQVGLPQQMNWLSLNTRRDWLPWPRLTTAFERLYRQFEQGDIFFDELTRKMLDQAVPQLPSLTHASARPASSRSALVDDRKECRLIASELVAAMISAKVNGYNLTQVEPRIRRYLTLQGRSLQEPSLLMESIAALEQTAKNLQLEEVTGAALPYTYESLFLRKNSTLEYVLSMWVDHYCQFEAEVQSMLEPQVITARLREEHISPDAAIEDLQARYQLFGYHNFAREAGSDHMYLLLIPGTASEDFFRSLDRVQLPHFQWVRFPDEEKLIYMRVHRTHSRR